VSGSFIVYIVLKKLVGIRLTAEEEFDGADLSIHKINSTADD
jgi:Amt family ammonium transporter